MCCRHCRFLGRKEKKDISDIIEENAYQRIFDRMNNEINRLWQRSIFLGTFLVLIFVGYGNVLLRLFGADASKFYYESPLNIVCVGISILGIVFSILWIMMAKGSKAWQEKYERTIYEFENDEVNWNTNLRCLVEKGIIHGRLKGVPSNKFDNCILNRGAGAYSPSKLNIALGQISLVLWGLCALFHFIGYCTANDFNKIMNDNCTWGVVFPAVAFICECTNILCGCKSSVIQEKQIQEKIEEEIRKRKSHENK